MAPTCIVNFHELYDYIEIESSHFQQLTDFKLETRVIYSSILESLLTVILYMATTTSQFFSTLPFSLCCVNVNILLATT